MDASWCATDPVERWRSSVERTSAFSELEERLAQCRAQGSGYFEVGRVDQDFPYFMLGFGGEHAVLYRLDSEEAMLVHLGDGSVPQEDCVVVQVMENDNSVSGRFVLTLDRAWSLVEEFVASGTTGGADEWLEL